MTELIPQYRDIRLVIVLRAYLKHVIRLLQDTLIGKLFHRFPARYTACDLRETLISVMYIVRNCELFNFLTHFCSSARINRRRFPTTTIAHYLLLRCSLALIST